MTTVQDYVLFLRFKKDEMVELMFNLFGLNGLSRKTREELADHFCLAWREAQQTRAVLRANNEQDSEHSEQDSEHSEQDSEHSEKDARNEPRELRDNEHSEKDATQDIPIVSLGSGDLRTLVRIPSQNKTKDLFFYHDASATSADLLNSLGEAINPDNSIVKVIGVQSEVPLYETISSLGAEGLLVLPKLKGGGKRTKTMSEADALLTTKQLRQAIDENILRLENISNPAPVVQETIEKVRFIIQATKDNPKEVVSELLEHVSDEKLTVLISSILTTSTRVMDRCRFVKENFLEDLHNKTEDLIKQKNLTEDTLVLGIRFAISSQFAETNGSIAWTALIAKMTSIIRSRASSSTTTTEDEGNCILM